MATPTQKSTLAADAIAKLTDELKDKPLIEALFTSDSSGRLDVIPAGAPETFIVVINNMPYEYTSALFETAAEIGEAFAEHINTLTTILESFEGLTAGIEFAADRIHGTWFHTITGQLEPDLGGFIVQDTDPLLGFKGIRTDFSQGVPITVAGPEMMHAAAILGYVGIGNALQKFVVKFKIPTTFPGPSLKAQGATILVINTAFNSSSDDRTASLVYQPDGGGGYEFELVLTRTGGTPVDTQTTPEATFVDGLWHEMEVTFDLAGTYFNVDIDSGTLTSNNVLANPISGLVSFFIGVFSNGITAPLTDIPDISYDDFELGTALDNQTADARGFQIVDSDDYFYLVARTPNDTITVENSSNMALNRLSVIDQLQELENTYFDLIENRALDTAEGEQLDKLGENLGLDREPGQTDAEYRILLETQIAANLSNGEAETLIEVTSVLTDSSLVKLNDYYPAHVIIEFNGDASNPSLISTRIRRIKAAGVGLDLIKYIETEAFVFEGTTGEGFSSTQDTATGGTFSSKIGL
jgi:hypothetical protein